MIGVNRVVKTFKSLNQEVDTNATSTNKVDTEESITENIYIRDLGLMGFLSIYGVSSAIAQKQFREFNLDTSH